ncbi:hypothetical protein KIPB_001150 [Kipferlia bialata]|uniref:Uncharacterized protein n=1 Tax=Kipferlia bialata TaxID=797122 RepID=A0A9K3CQA1_9EUKA|nr:hypothetical protein KIPB_001150 [Kipferlia bialata]|eukprot:g1150.t1
MPVPLSFVQRLTSMGQASGMRSSRLSTSQTYQTPPAPLAAGTTASLVRTLLAGPTYSSLSVPVGESSSLPRASQSPETATATPARQPFHRPGERPQEPEEIEAEARGSRRVAEGQRGGRTPTHSTPGRERERVVPSRIGSNPPSRGGRSGRVGRGAPASREAIGTRGKQPSAEKAEKGQGEGVDVPRKRVPSAAAIEAASRRYTDLVIHERLSQIHLGYGASVRMVGQDSLTSEPALILTRPPGGWRERDRQREREGGVGRVRQSVERDIRGLLAGLVSSPADISLGLSVLVKMVPREIPEERGRRGEGREREREMRVTKADMAEAVAAEIALGAPLPRCKPSSRPQISTTKPKRVRERERQIEERRQREREEAERNRHTQSMKVKSVSSRLLRETVSTKAKRGSDREYGPDHGTLDHITLNDTAQIHRTGADELTEKQKERLQQKRLRQQLVIDREKAEGPEMTVYTGEEADTAHKEKRERERERERESPKAKWTKERMATLSRVRELPVQKEPLGDDYTFRPNLSLTSNTTNRLLHTRSGSVEPGRSPRLSDTHGSVDSSVQRLLRPRSSSVSRALERATESPTVKNRRMEAILCQARQREDRVDTANREREREREREIQRSLEGKTVEAENPAAPAVSTLSGAQVKRHSQRLTLSPAKARQTPEEEEDGAWQKEKKDLQSAVWSLASLGRGQPSDVLERLAKAKLARTHGDPSNITTAKTHAKPNTSYSTRSPILMRLHGAMSPTTKQSSMLQFSDADLSLREGSCTPTLERDSLPAFSDRGDGYEDEDEDERERAVRRAAVSRLKERYTLSDDSAPAESERETEGEREAEGDRDMVVSDLGPSLIEREREGYATHHKKKETTYSSLHEISMTNFLESSVDEEELERERERERESQVKGGRRVVSRGSRGTTKGSRVREEQETESDPFLQFSRPRQMSTAPSPAAAMRMTGHRAQAKPERKSRKQPSRSTFGASSPEVSTEEAKSQSKKERERERDRQRGESLGIDVLRNQSHPKGTCASPRL